MMKLHRYWITFTPAADHVWAHHAGRSCGVTAWDLEDALALVRRTVFEGNALPVIESVVEDVDVSTLDSGHVLPNMLPPHERGVWYPGHTYS
jgi:hypothetical protein